MDSFNIIFTSMLSGLGGAMLTGLIVTFKKISSLTQAIKALSHDALFSRCEMLIERGSITTDDLENLSYLYEAYQGMGLNGTGTELYTRAKNLPLK